MEREIKFRGFTKDFGKNEFVFGNYTLQNNGDNHFIIPKGMLTGCLGFYNVDPESVGQYTGLKDKSGKEIYEMDIVKDVTDNKISLVPSYNPLSIYGYVLSFEGSPVTLWEAHQDLEIIGNIYENPELLK